MCSSWKLQRVLLGVTQRDLALRAKIPIYRLRRIEGGRSVPTVREEAALIAAFRSAEDSAHFERRLITGAEERA